MHGMMRGWRERQSQADMIARCSFFRHLFLFRDGFILVLPMMRPVSLACFCSCFTLFPYVYDESCVTVLPSGVRFASVCSSHAMSALFAFAVILFV